MLLCIYEATVHYTGLYRATHIVLKQGGQISLEVTGKRRKNCWSARNCLLSRVDICSLYRGILYVWASELSSSYQGFRYIEVLSHTFYCNFGQAEEHLRYTEDFVVQRFVKSRFPCVLFEKAVQGSTRSHGCDSV